MPTAWQIWVDTGGTFTDCLALDPARHLHRLKILSNSAIRGTVTEQLSPQRLKVAVVWPAKKHIYKGYSIRFYGADIPENEISRVDFDDSEIILTKPLRKETTGITFEITSGEEVPVLAARLITATPLHQPLPPLEMKLGSTRGTNAILEKKGARTALIITRGFRDLLTIGTQQRPELFALNVQKPQPLYAAVVEVDERINAEGNIIKKLSRKECQCIAEELKKKKIESVAIAFVNSYKNGTHELLLKKHLQHHHFRFVSASHQLAPQIKILPRAETTVANAYLAPIIEQYLGGIRAGLANADLKVMSSAGSLLSAANFHPKDSLLSGPAGGVVGACTVAGLSGLDKLITFDMGGTSTDVALYNQRYQYRFESHVGDFRILSPSLAIETIAAGGGSICSFDGFKLSVGPESAGAFPGPACYGAGGPLTITDVNLLLGRIDAAEFAMPLHLQRARLVLDKLLMEIEGATGTKPDATAILESFIQIANEKMADAIRKVSVQQGHAPEDFTLLAFGGAGGQHVCALAELLQVKKALVPYDAGLLSALGIGHAHVERFAEEQVLQPLEQLHPLQDRIQQVTQRALYMLIQEGYPEEKIKITHRMVYLRFKGQESSIEVPYRSANTLRSAFRKKYEALYGHWLPDRPIEIESIKVVAAVSGYRARRRHSVPASYQPKSLRQNVLTWHGKQLRCPVYRWEQLKPGAEIAGPAIIVSNNSTTVVDKAWRFLLDAHNNGLLMASARKSQASTHTATALLELFTNRFTAVADEMGALLQRTAFSVNVKERLDFSCAVLDAKGYLVVNAPHIPVHLGSLGMCVRSVHNAVRIQKGDVIITNHPAFGGSHLPDVTLIKAVFYHGRKIGYVANRAHHAEIGGKQPGSMPADGRTLEEEGVIIAPTYLVRGGHVQWETIKALFTNAIYPTRLLHENMADLNGALAAINLGEQLLMNMCALYRPAMVTANMEKLRVYAAAVLAQKLAKLKAKQWRATERLDDGSVLAVKITANRGKLTIDFSGTAPVQAGNLNATPAIVQSVVLYVLRLLVNEPVPMNEGLMKDVKVLLPRCLLHPDFKNTVPAVVGGNTEVSQRLTDTLLKAFGLAACSQGTMNNFLFGNNTFGYYETICGGTGAGPGFNGADAVHQHMTNTRITDAEVLEFRYPVRLIRFEVRKNSGGKGQWNGGNGVVREVEALTVLNVNLLTQHRVEMPYGLKGGAAGKGGKQYIIRENGSRMTLSGIAGTQLQPGDRIVIETPGGGGYGQS